FRKARTPEETAAAARLEWLKLPTTNAIPVFDSAKSKPPVVANIIVAWTPANVQRPATNQAVWDFGAPATPERVRDLIQNVLGGSAQGATGAKFSKYAISNLSPARISLRVDALPSAADVARLVPADLATNLGRLCVLPTWDRSAFQVILTNVHVTAAADYLAWSDQYAPAFDDVREALKRPYAILPGDYTLPYDIPIPNFVLLRSMAQTLAQRTQCYLLLGQPDKALRELTLMHDVCRILQKPPAGKPETIVEAMINVAVMGVYANTIADGLRWHAWQEPQLSALQGQLQSVNVIPFVWDALHTEPAAVCRDFEVLPLPKLLSMDSRRSGPWALMPRGWVYQNMATVATLRQDIFRGFDPTNTLITPRLADAAMRNTERFFKRHLSPYTFLAAWTTPNFQKAVQTTFYNQTQINEAQIACALERYRLAHREYPERLDALLPQFLETLPHELIQTTPGAELQPLQYRRGEDDKFALYSIGWNERDDGGKDSADHGKGDWVWGNGN
ncbi:MAG TPA: hypothetical protein VF988_11740, partial [Verrucomicrobiae bacterium]